MNAWFGPRGGAPYEDDMPHVPTPVGETCERCGEALAEGDAGLTVPRYGADGWRPAPYHYECHMRAIVGGLNHLQGACRCCGGDQPPDPPGMTRREAAQAAVDHWHRHGLMRRSYLGED